MLVTGRVRLSNRCSLRRSRSPAPLNVGNRPASKDVTERYEGLWCSPLKPTTFAMGHLRIFPASQAMPDLPLEADNLDLWVHA